MNKIKIQHGLYKNLPSGCIYNSQAACIIFTLCIAFKLSAAPGIISEFYGSSTLWLYLIMLCVETALTAVMFAFVRMRGDDFLTAVGSKAYRVCCGVAALWLTFKGAFYYCYCVSYLTHELFGGVEPALIYILFLAPVVYLGAKGARSISRTAEIFVPIFFALFVLNLIFVEADMDFGRNLPVFAIEPIEFFKEMPKYGLWLGDALPFIFLRIKNKRLPYITAGFTISIALTAIAVALGVALYGEALQTVSDLLIHLAGFNKLSMDIGRMEWTNLFGVVTLSVMSLAFLYYGAIEGCGRAFKNPVLGKIIYPLAVLTVILSASSTQEVMQFSVSAVGYGLFAVAIVLPLSLLGVCLYSKAKFKGVYNCLDEEYIPYPAPKPERPFSLADNIMAGFKEDAARNAVANDNGSLEFDKETDK